MTLDDCEDIFRRARSSNSEAAFCCAIEPLLEEYGILSIELGQGNVFWRARLADGDPHPNLSDLCYPPAHLAKRGRLNDYGSPCFYIAARLETAISEIGATEGQLVQLAGFDIKSDAPIRLAVIGEYANVQKNGYMHFPGIDPGTTISRSLNALPHREALKTLYIDRFFASVLADETADTNEYLHSRALGQAIYSRVGVNGIVFPSVKDRGGFNIAVQPRPSDRSFQNVCCVVIRKGRPREFGLIEYSTVKTASGLDSHGNFIWP